LFAEEIAMSLRFTHYSLMASWHSQSKGVRRKAESRLELRKHLYEFEESMVHMCVKEQPRKQAASTRAFMVSAWD
jgi:hypothetical protein